MGLEVKVLEEFFKHLQLKGSSPYTIKAYRLDLADFLKHLKEVVRGSEHQEEDGQLYDFLINATSVELRTYKDYLGQSSPATIQRKFITLRKFLAWALKERHRKNPVPDCPNLPTTQTLAPRWIAKNDLKALLRNVEKKGSKRDLAIIGMLFHTGLRVSELVALKWEDVDIGRYEGLLKVRKGKGQKMRIVPLNTVARKVLVELREARNQNNEYLFYGERGRLTENGVLKLFYSLTRNMKTRITPHNLRHTFCKTLLDNAVTLEKVSALAGHSSLTTTQKYVTPSLQDLGNSVKTLEE